MKYVVFILAALLVAASVGVVSAAEHPAPLVASFTASKTVMTGGAFSGDVNFISTSTGNITRHQWYIDGYAFGDNVAMLSTTFPWVDKTETHMVLLRVYHNEKYAESKPLTVTINPMDVPTTSPVETQVQTTRQEISVAVFRPATGNWYFDYNLDGIVDKSLHFGTKGDIPFSGDWNSDGVDDIAVFRPVTGNWYFDNNADGVTDVSFHFGANGDIPMIGRWSA